MLEKAIAYLVNLGDSKNIHTKEINGDTYTTDDLHRVAPYIARPRSIEVNGLESIVKLVQNEIDLFPNTPVCIRVSSPREVKVFTTLDDEMERDYLYTAVCDAPEFHPGWMSHEEAVIKLRSAFIPNDDTEYLLGLLGRICKEENVSTEDNGVSQSVTARSGISLKTYEAVKPRVTLRPYRIFTEVEQPESEFILRVDDEKGVGLIAADGGAWKITAKATICCYFEEALKNEIAASRVVVMM